MTSLLEKYIEKLSPSSDPSSPVLYAVPVLAAVASILGVRLLLKSGKSKVSLPPGPKGYPVIGNALDIPSSYEWVKFRELCQQANSDIIYLEALGQKVIIIDKYETAVDLLEKRSGIYSSRPHVPMAALMGEWDEMQFAFSPYGNTWRHKRRLFHQIVNEHTNPRYLPLIQKNANRLMNVLLDDPEKFFAYIHMSASNSTLELAYGYGMKSIEDPKFVRFEECSEAVVKSTSPGAHLVNVFPILQYVPSWFPGAGWKKYAKHWADVSKQIIDQTYEDAIKYIQEGNSTPSFVLDALRELTSDSKPNLTPEEERIVMSVAVSMYGAGADTSTAMIQTFILLMASHPHIQKRAYLEVTKITRKGHLPSYLEDKDSSPYLMATVMEVLRWGSAAPLGVPHMIENDDIYRGYRIPGGSAIITNIWSMMRDEEMYPDPEAFNPSRFLNEDGTLNENIRSPFEVVFGFGRRLCPGKHFAIMSLWTYVTTLLSVFEMLPTKDEGLKLEFKPGIVLHPAHFECQFVPRSEEIVKVVREYQTVNA